jgi:hypothetical protein
MNNKQTSWVVGAILAVGLAIVLVLASRPNPEPTKSYIPIAYPMPGSQPTESPGETWQSEQQEREQQAQLDCLSKGWEWRYGLCSPPTSSEGAPEPVQGIGYMFETLCEERGHHWVDTGVGGYCVD